MTNKSKVTMPQRRDSKLGAIQHENELSRQKTLKAIDYEAGRKAIIDKRDTYDPKSAEFAVIEAMRTINLSNYSSSQMKALTDFCTDVVAKVVEKPEYQGRVKEVLMASLHAVGSRNYEKTTPEQLEEKIFNTASPINEIPIDSSKMVNISISSKRNNGTFKKPIKFEKKSEDFLPSL